MVPLFIMYKDKEETAGGAKSEIILGSVIELISAIYINN